MKKVFLCVLVSACAYAAPAMKCRVEAGRTTGTRPICMYPLVAKFKGSGSIDAAENFSCGAQ